MNKSKKNKGFTLLEVMIVLAILGMIIGMVSSNLLDNADEAKLRTTAIEIKNLGTTLDMYKLKAGSYPTTEQGIEALVSEPEIEPIPRNYPEGGYLDSVPEDEWGNPFILVSPGENGKYDLYSMGPDGQEGTEDDIGNWNAQDYL